MQISSQEYYLLRCDAVLPDRTSKTFRRKVLPPSSESKPRLRKQLTSSTLSLLASCKFRGLFVDPEEGGSINLRNVSSWTASKLHLTSVRTSHFSQMIRKICCLPFPIRDPVPKVPYYDVIFKLVEACSREAGYRSGYSDWLRAGRPRVRSSSLRGARFFSSPCCPDRGPSSLISNG
jgi:hypothetical protein